MRSIPQKTRFKTGKTAAALIIAAVMLCAFGDFQWARGQAGGQENAFGVYKEAKLAIYQREWHRAVDLLKTMERDYPRSKYSEESVYWLAYSLDKLGMDYKDPARGAAVKEEALGHLNRLISIETGKESPWLDDAKILRIRIASDLVQTGREGYLEYIVEAVSAAENTETDLVVVALDVLIRLDMKTALPYLEKIVKETKNTELRTKIVFILENSSDRRLRTLLRQTVLAHPRWIRKVDPTYPIEALRKTVTGEVVLEVATGPEGNVLRAVVQSGHPLLREAAEEAVKKWKHAPTPVDGAPTSRVFTVSIVFEIY